MKSNYDKNIPHDSCAYSLSSASDLSKFSTVQQKEVRKIKPKKYGRCPGLK
jgi:hypothetical protein